MALEGEQDFACVEIPNSPDVVCASGHNTGAIGVEANAVHACVLLEDFE